MAPKFCPLAGHSCVETDCMWWIITRIDGRTGEYCDCAIAKIARDIGAIAWHRGAVD